MTQLGYPNISVGKKTNEENMQSVKGYLSEMAEQLNYQISYLESKVEQLEAIVRKLEEDKK